MDSSKIDNTHEPGTDTPAKKQGVFRRIVSFHTSPATNAIRRTTAPIRGFFAVISLLFLRITESIPQLPNKIVIKRKLRLSDVLTTGWVWLFFPVAVLVLYENTIWWWIDFGASLLPSLTIIGATYWINRSYDKTNRVSDKEGPTS